MSVDLLSKIRSAQNLPSLPSVAIEVLALAKKDDVSIDELGSVIQRDPALAGKLLSYVNSSSFGIPRQVASLPQAVGLLGIRSVKVMALSFSLVNAVRESESDTLDYEAYWRRSITSAVAARMIARKALPRMAEESFVAGLLSTIGIMAADRCAPELYGPILTLSAESARPLAEVEREVLGFTHAEMGQALLETWALPPVLSNAVGCANGDGLDALDGEDRQIAGFVCAAAAIASLFCKDVVASDLDSIKARCIEVAAIQESALEEILEHLDERVREVASMLAVNVGETANYAALQVEAMATLAQLSMQAEVDRVDATHKAEQARYESKQLLKERKAILKMAATDSLTGIGNRAAFDQKLKEEWSRATSKRESLALIMLDIDHFKRFNDDHGHRAGDAVLESVGKILAKTVGNFGFVARYGGEEFCVILTGEKPDLVAALAEKIRRAIEASSIDHEGATLRVTASLGAAWTTLDAGIKQPQQLVEAADQQLYVAKKNGRNRVAVNQPIGAAAR